MSEHASIGWGLVGASNIAREYMVGAIRAQKGHSVRAIQSSSIDRARAFAKDLDIPAAYSSLNALLADPEVDVVYISTTNELHYSQALAAAAAGKHILCEKPLALKVEQAQEMAAAARAAKVLMATNHHLRNAATHRAIRQLIQEDAIGRPLFARVFHAVHLPPSLQGWRINNPAAGGGVTLDITVHDIDTLRFTLGCEPVEVAALSQSSAMAQEGLEDGVMAVVRFENGTLVQLHDAFTVKYANTGIEYHGEKGSIYGVNVMTQKPVGDVIVRNESGERKIAIAHESLYERSVSEFCNAMQGRGRPAATAEDGVRSLAGALAVLEACKTGSSQRIAI